MALSPDDEIHALQIQAGILGRKAGHAFEDKITDEINSLIYPFPVDQPLNSHVSIGDPAKTLLAYVASTLRATTVLSARALCRLAVCGNIVWYARGFVCVCHVRHTRSYSWCLLECCLFI